MRSYKGYLGNLGFLKLSFLQNFVVCFFLEGLWLILINCFSDKKTCCSGGGGDGAT